MGYAIEETTDSAGATEYTEDAASAANPAGGQLMARRRDTLSTETTTDGDVTALNSTGKGELYVKHADAIATTNVISDAAIKDEDAAHSSGDKGIMALAVRRDANTSAAGADNDYIPLTTSRKGSLWVAPEFGKETPIYCFHTGSIVHVAAASTLMLDMFNADAALVVRILSIQHIVNLETAVTGIGFEWQLLRTTAVGTGGTSLTAWLADTNDAALDSDITARTKATGGATASTSLKWWYSNSEETLAGNQLQGGVFSVTNVLPQFLETTGKGLVLRQNQGIRINQETNSNAGNSAFMIFFSVE